MAGGDGSCVGGWIPTDSVDAQRSVHNGFSMLEMEKQFGTIFTPGRKFYAYYKCNGIVPCHGTDGFDGMFTPIPNKPSPYAAGHPIGFNDWMNHRVARLIRKPTNLTPTNRQADATHNGLYLDLTGWKTSQNVNLRVTTSVNDSGHFISFHLYGPVNGSGGSTPFTGGYSLRGNSDTSQNYGGTNWVTHNENAGTSNHTIKGGYYYMLRSHDHSANSSGVYMGGEFQGGGAGTASGNREDITIHDAGPCCGDNNEGGNADLRVNLSITGRS